VSASDGIDTGRLGRLLALIAFVTAVFVFLAAERLTGTSLNIAIGAIGSIAVVTAMTGFLIALGASYDRQEGL
jgi:low affinity Fe/Cu permease